MGLSIYQSQPDPRLGFGEISPELARSLRERRRTAGPDGGDDLIRTQPGPELSGIWKWSEYMRALAHGSPGQRAG